MVRWQVKNDGRIGNFDYRNRKLSFYLDIIEAKDRIRKEKEVDFDYDEESWMLLSCKHFQDYVNAIEDGLLLDCQIKLLQIIGSFYD